MKGITKLGLTLVTMGGACMMAAPAAFADDLASAFQGTGAVTCQTQDGTLAGDAVMQQNSSIQIGQMQAADYYNNQNSFGFETSGTSGTTTDGTNGTGSTTWENNYGGNSTTKAENFAEQQAAVNQSQSQIIGDYWYKNWDNSSIGDDGLSSDNSHSAYGGGTGGVQSQGGGVLSVQDTSNLLGMLFDSFNGNVSI